jgi:uncharacterized protein YndB with AHSA1/START domain
MAEETTLFLTRTFPVPRRKVFEAWTTPAVMARWFAAGPEMIPTVAEMDLRIGGTYRIGMKHRTKGVEHIATGVYREIIPDSRLSFTWSWEEKPDEHESLVSIEFVEQGDSTEMRFTHSRFANQKLRDDHRHGWDMCFAGLEKSLHAPDIARTQP